MKKKVLNLIHPGEILLEEFMQPMNLTQYRIAADLQVSQIRISEIIHGKRALTANTAIRLSKYFGNSPQFWMNLQANYDLQKELQGKNKKVFKTVKFFKRAA